MHKSTFMILSSQALGFPWVTADPFLFCAYHNDRYPAGNGQLGPRASLAGRSLGSDFAGLDGWSMYHGQAVPGFPQHPHRGFETISIVRSGLVDHSDSLGARARFGRGDVQWMTAGKGIVHSEMFPLVHDDRENPLEMLQIWLNLPAKNKLAEPYFTMFWGEDMPRTAQAEPSVDSGDGADVRLIAGGLGQHAALAPPPDSWASDPANDVLIATVDLPLEASIELEGARDGALRTVYFFQGDRLEVAGQSFGQHAAIEVAADQTLKLANRGAVPAAVLVLQGKPIAEPVAHHGPFVMNTRQELMQAMRDYGATQFGGWPWGADDPVHDKSQGRFAQHADGRIEERALAK